MPQKIYNSLNCQLKKRTNLAIEHAIKNLPHNSNLLLGIGLNSECPWKEDDRLWFEKNKTRSFRVRRRYEGEFPALNTDELTHVIVQQVTPGFRNKFLLGVGLSGLNFDEISQDEQDEPLLMALWKHVSAANGKPILIADVIKQAKQIVAYASSLKGGIQ